MRNYDFLFSDKRLYVYRKRVTRAVKGMTRPEENYVLNGVKLCFFNINSSKTKPNFK